jgi:REP element-mobilizing transposase RayT
MAGAEGPYQTMVRDFEDNEFPLAYLITFRTYGTWLRGDERGSMDREHNSYGTPRIAPNPTLEKADAVRLQHSPLALDTRQRQVVEQAIREVCHHRSYLLRAVNVRTNHAHTVVTAACEPEPMMDAFKAYATRALRRAGLLAVNVKAWVRHGSTRYLWKERHVAKAVDLYYTGRVMNWRRSKIDSEAGEEP